MSDKVFAVALRSGQINRILVLLSNEEATLVGRLVLAEERLDLRREGGSITERQNERAERAKLAIPRQLAELREAKRRLAEALREARDLGEPV